MEGEKETAEEKEEEDKELHHQIAATTSSVDCQDLPIMHWEDLSQRIAELEKQEQERRERSKVSRKRGVTMVLLILGSLVLSVGISLTNCICFYITFPLTNTQLSLFPCLQYSPVVSIYL